VTWVHLMSIEIGSSCSGHTAFCRDRGREAAGHTKGLARPSSYTAEARISSSLVKSTRQFVERDTRLGSGQITCRGSGWPPGRESTHVLVLLTDIALAVLMRGLIWPQGPQGRAGRTFLTIACVQRRWKQLDLHSLTKSPFTLHRSVLTRRLAKSADDLPHQRHSASRTRTAVGCIIQDEWRMQHVAPAPRAFP
jgi:hypothetical protein